MAGGGEFVTRDTWRVTSAGELVRGGAGATAASNPVYSLPSAVYSSSPVTRHVSRVTPPKPFVLTRQGKPAGEFKTFAALWDAHQPGDEIVVHGDGPFVVPPLEIKDQALVLKAAPGFRPTLSPDQQLFDLHNTRDWFNLRLGALTIEGCDLRVIGLPLKARPPSLISGEAGGPCTLRNCRVLGFNRVFGGAMHAAPRLNIEDCLLILGETIHLPPGCEATLTNNVIWSGGLFGFGGPGGQTVRLTHNTILLDGNWLWHAPGGVVNGISVVAEGNVVQSLGWRWGIDDSWKPHIHWRGKDNCFAGLWRGPDGNMPGLEFWNRQVGQPETGGRELREPPFAWRTDLPGDAAQASAWWQGRLAPHSPKAAWTTSGPTCRWSGPGRPTCGRWRPTGIRCPRSGCGRRNCPAGRSC